MRKLMLAGLMAVAVGGAGATAAAVLSGPGAGRYAIMTGAGELTGTHQIEFEGGRRAVVSVIEEADFPLAVVVRDRAGRVVASAEPNAPLATVMWTPPETGVYTVAVELRGKVCGTPQVRYVLTHNSFAREARPGPVGAGAVVARVTADAEADHRVTFEGGRRAAVSVCGDGDTDLDVEVFDAQGQLVASDYNLIDVATVSWTPARTGEFTVRVRNLGGVWNQYILTCR